MRRKIYNRIIFDIVCFVLSGYDLVVVGGDEDDLVDVFGFEVVQFGEVGGYVGDLVGWSEGVGDGDEDYFFGGEFFVGVVLDVDVVGGDVEVVGGGDVGEGYVGGEGVVCFEIGYFDG